MTSQNKPADKTIAIVGTGLIGGSLALSIKEYKLASHIIGVDANLDHAQKALSLKIVDEILPLHEAIERSELVVLAIPVNAVVDMLPALMSIVTTQVIMDTGSTKSKLIDIIKHHPRRGRFVPTHPMWGTEFSGPEAAVKNAFIDKAVVICDAHASDKDAVAMCEELYRKIGMHLIYMNAADHDLHTAYISHISHITSFALANTVLEKEKEEDAIFELASGGFESTVRLAKSSPEMWLPIFQQNRENVLDVLNEHITQLKKFKSCLEKENYEYLYELMQHANTIRKILK